MHCSCICFTLLFAASFGLQLEQFALTSDYNPFFDRLLVSVQNANPVYLTLPPVNLDITQIFTNSSTQVATFSSLNPILANLKSVRRISDVNPRLTSGNMTLGTNVSIGSLIISFPESKLTVIGQECDVSATATVRTNVIEMSMTAYSKANGACAVDLWLLKIVVLDDIGITLIPWGFFNQVQMSARIHNMDQAVVKKIKIDPKPLEKVIEKALCSQVIT